MNTQDDKLKADLAAVAPVATSLATDIAAHCAAFEQSPEYSAMIGKHVAALYEGAIKDTFRWGNFPDAVKKALESALPANITEMVDLPRYNLLLAKELETLWAGNAVGEQITGSMQALVLNFVKSHNVPKYIKASALWEAYTEEHKEEAAHDGWERPEVLMEHSEHGTFSIGLDKKPFVSSGYSSSRAKTHVHQFNDNLYFMKVKNREGEGRDQTDVTEQHEGHDVYSLYSGQLDESVLGKQVMSFRGDFGKLVGALYYGESLLVLDCDEADEVYYPGYD